MHSTSTRTATLLAMLLSVACSHGSSRVTPPGTFTESSARSKVAQRIDRYLSAASSFGFSAAVLIADRDAIVLRRGYGPADATRRIAPNMLFDMGSMTKQFTAAAILMLESEGKLTTNDRLSKFFTNVPSDKAEITLHQMMTHSSGLTENFADDYDQISRDSAVRAAFALPLQSVPGKEFHYSNAAFSLLAVIIEQISGQSYDQFMYERIYHPVGMEHTGYRIPRLDSTLVAHSFTPPVDQGTPAERLAKAGGPGWNLKGNGGVLTSVDDLYRYESALRTGLPISQTLQAKQFAEQFRRSPVLAHGFDWWIEPAEDGGIQFNRGGDGPETGVVAEYRRYPKDSSTFIMLANNRHHGWSTRRYVMPILRRLYVGDSAPLPPIVHGARTSDLENIAGSYRIDSTSFVRITRNGDHLAMSAIGQTASDIMVFNRDSNSVRNRVRINQRAIDLFTALTKADTVALRPAFGDDQTEIRRVLLAWRDLTTRLGPLQCVRVLGTDRLDRAAFLTTVELRFANGSHITRWAWSGPLVVTNSEDCGLPSTLQFGADAPIAAGVWSPYWWFAGRDTVLTYDLVSNQTLLASLQRNTSGQVQQLQFALPNKTITAIRIDAEMERRLADRSCVAFR